MKRNNIYIIIFFLMTLIGFSGCKDNELEEVTKLQVDRVFSSPGLTATIVNKTGVKLTWNAVPNATSYTIEVYDNADFTGTPVKSIASVTVAQLPYTVTGLIGDTQYSIRVKGVAQGVADSKWVSTSVKTEPEQIFQDILPAKLTSRTVTLNWPVGENATTISINPGNITRPVTPAEVLAGEVILTGLSPKVSYTVTLFLGSTIRGTKTFTTPAELPTGADVVILSATDDLAAMITAATKSTRFVILEGTKYNADVAFTLPAGIDISIIGEVATVKPIISFTQIILPTMGGKLRFENVDITAYAKGDETTTRRQYLINQSLATNMDEVSFENCNIRHFVNSPLRIQSTNAITINKVIVNNCIIDNISIADAGPGVGNYAFINSNVATGKINNITLTNNTFSNIGFGLILHNAAPSLSVAIENNTFYNVVGDGRYFIDYNAQTISGGFSFKNNIITKTISPAATARGIRSATAPTVTNSYQTSDVVFTANAIPGITAYAGTSATLLTAPTTKNFKIKDDGFVGKSTSGDPRWRL
ncbi:DUF5123 domain-containing protein [Pedobacter sp. MR2016-19]|uniref:DUF5123 domain-containing protein n=1 Tax=unclassified Pedobacter TaxID=2628915 RepID=UPI0018742CDF|nr:MULTISPECIES: DUF5123 domain-containing protein [unclassified Pedobacter]MBE5317628.1 DUF5123 domain-containing protein [Pedobacter sp. MR2016-19]QXU41566.1 DUF5123 domain-containing protein [Pedobacter sp. D749]